jgi:hypothetical protein
VRPNPSPDDHGQAWRDLFVVAKQFGALAPWRWMGDQAVFGVLDPETDQIGWCCVIGAAGELMGLALYRGDEGFDLYRRMQAGEDLRDEIAFGQDALILVFVDREELSAGERALVRRSGVTFRGRGQWPQLESHGSGRLPMAPAIPEVRRMGVALEQAVGVGSRVRQNPSLLDLDQDGRLLVRIPPARSGEEWQDARRTPPPSGTRPVPEFDRPRAERLRSALRRSPTILECDLFPAQAVMGEQGKPPYSPAVFLLADAQTGMVLRTEVAEPTGRDRWAQDQLMAGLEGSGALPMLLRVKRCDLERVLAPLTATLGIRIERVEGLAAVEPARAVFDQAMIERGRTRV